MANRVASYFVSHKQPHLEWGTYRFTGSRGEVYGEGYTHILESTEALNLL